MTDNQTPDPNQPAAVEPIAAVPSAVPADSQPQGGAPTPAAPVAPQPAANPVTQTQNIGRYQVTVDRSKCIGAASCVALAPKVFQLDETKIAKIISQDGDPDDMKLLAAQSCPTMAINITDTQTGQQVWPPQG